MEEGRMATRSKTKPALTNGVKSRLDQLGSLIGQERYYLIEGRYGEEKGCAVLVKVVDVRFPSCGLKIVVEPVGGIGRFDACLKDLLTKEQVGQRNKLRDAKIRVKQEFDEMFRHTNYVREKRVRFQRWLETVSADEREKIQEEYKGNLLNLTESQMRDIVEKSLTIKHEAYDDPADDDDEDSDE
jgi:hypothetical protein